MRVRMLTLSASPEGIIDRGQIVDLPDDKAATFVTNGFAEYIEKHKEVIPDAVQRKNKELNGRVDQPAGGKKPRKSSAG